MTDDTARPGKALLGETGELELDAVRPLFARVSRIAAALFDAPIADVIIAQGERFWRGAAIGSDDARGARAVLDADKAIWLTYGDDNEAFRDHPMVVGPPYLKFYAGAPIRLPGRPPVGVLCVMDSNPRPFDPALADRLADLADLVADECRLLLADKALARAETDAAATRGAFSAFVEAHPSALVMTDRDMTILRCSPRWPEEMGLEAEGLLGRSFYDLFPAARGRLAATYAHCLAGNVVRGERVRLALPDGRRPWVHAEVAPWRDPDGAVGGLMIMTHDVTEVVTQLMEADRAQRRMQLAASLAELHVWEFDLRRNTMAWSGAPPTFLDREFSRAELMNQDLVMVHPDDRERVMAHAAADIQRGYATPAEYRTNRQDGREVWVSGITDVVMENDKPVRLVGAVRDITAARLAEREMAAAREAAEAASHAKSAFLATMSHEIRTPLNGVLGMAQAMAADELAPHQRERLDVVRRSGESLLAVLNDILDLSKIEAGKLELESSDFSLADLASGAHAAFTAVAASRGLAFDLVVAGGALGVYRGDSTRLRQILYNLISNALKFTEVGHVRVDVDHDGEALILTVADTGVGIPPEALSRLFDRFVQADASTTRRYGGAGLGLAICRELAELMAGEIHAESVVGQGATFRVRLPLPRIGDVAPLSAPPADGSRDEAGEAIDIRVLAAEDNAVNQLVLRTLLSQVGIEPVIVGDGRKAVEAWETGAWDVILMDVQMPELDGPSATREIRAREAATGRARTPIVAITANAMSHQVAEYLACGMDAFVAKPIEITRLYAVLQQILDGVDETETAAA